MPERVADSITNPTTATAAPAAVNDPAILSIDQQYRPAIKTATDAYTHATDEVAAAKTALAAVPGGVTHEDERKQAQDYLEKANSNLNVAAGNLSRIQEALANAYTTGSYATPEGKNLANARADDARAQADLRKSQAAVATATTDSDIKKAQAQAADALANAALTTAKVGVAQATTQAQIDQANIAVQQAQQNVQATQIANTTAAAQATTAQAQAAVSPQLAQTSVDQAQANVNKTLTDIAELQRQLRQAPTDEQAQAAIQTQLAQKQTDLQTAQQQLEQAQRLMPIAVESAGLSVEQQRANLQKQQQGPMYGVVDQIAKYKELIATGQMSPEAADAAISDYVTQQVTGSTALQRQTAQNQYQQSQYQTQTDFNRSMVQTGAGFMNQGLGTLTSALGTMTPGHGAEYAGAVGALANLWNQIGQRYAAPAPPPSAVQTAPVVHINIGGGQPTSADAGAAPVMPGPLNVAPVQPAVSGYGTPGGYQGAPNPNVFGSGMGPIPDHMRPATPADVQALWAGAGAT